MHNRKCSILFDSIDRNCFLKVDGLNLDSTWLFEEILKTQLKFDVFNFGSIEINH